MDTIIADAYKLFTQEHNHRSATRPTLYNHLYSRTKARHHGAMNRRQFLKIAIVSAGALVVGCGPKNNDNNTRSTNNTNNTAGTNNVGACDDELVNDATYFPQSVASGDPKDTSVILWTRIADDVDDDVTVELEIALDEDFTERFQLDEDACSIALTAEARFDHCLKARVTDLAPGTHYYYRFIYEKDGTRYVSNVGRTKTAPAAGEDVSVSFAFVSCQDYNGRYFNVYKRLNEEELDFVVHLGDYVYETTADPGFQMASEDRALVFRNPEEAIPFNEGMENAFFAAKSLGNYRDLYRTFRSDADLQRAHERYAFVIIWDDHEFSDDSHGANATYLDGAADELDVQRRKNANQAWFEYMPVDYLDDPDFAYDPDADFPGDIRIYRDIEYGGNVHLVMTDLRTYRSDHVIPEDLFPGVVLADQATLEAEVGELPEWADPYVDIATYQGGTYQTALQDAADDLGYPAAAITGDFSVTYANELIAAINEANPAAALEPIDPAGLDAGLTARSLGKTGPTGQLGSRYFVVHEPFDVYARLRYAESNGASEDILGPDQEAWFLDTMQNSSATWKVWGNEFCLVQRFIDVRPLSAIVGEAFAALYQLSAEDWDGARYKRDELIGQLAEIDNVVAITGDIHAFFAGVPYVSNDKSKRIIELVTAAVSSTTFKTILLNTTNTDPALQEANASTLADKIENFLFYSTKPNPPLAYASTQVHGFAKVVATADELRCTFFATSEDSALEDADAEFETREFHVKAGTKELFSTISGAEKRWDLDTAAWVDA